MRTIAERPTRISFSPSLTPRLALRPSAPAARTAPGRGGADRALLDGAWWPCSADPVTELPGLVLALQAHGSPDDRRPIEHIMLRTADWDSHPRLLLVNGPDDTRQVWLNWFDGFPAGQLTVLCVGGRRINLLTIPASTDEAAARAILEMVARPGTRLRVDDLPAALATSTAMHDLA